MPLHLLFCPLQISKHWRVLMPEMLQRTQESWLGCLEGNPEGMVLSTSLFYYYYYYFLLCLQARCSSATRKGSGMLPLNKTYSFFKKNIYSARPRELISLEKRSHLNFLICVEVYSYEYISTKDEGAPQCIMEEGESRGEDYFDKKYYH